MKTKHLLVFGGTGKVGAALISNMSSYYNRVHVLGSKQVDLLDPNSIEIFFNNLNPENFDVIFASAIIKHRFTDSSVLTKNVMMSYNLAEELRRRSLRHLVFLSSIDVYGIEPTLPISEYSAIKPSSYYGVAKFASEELLARSLPKGSVCTFRLPGVYSLVENGEQGVLGQFCRDLFFNGNCEVLGNPDLMRDYINVDDLALLIVDALIRKVSGTYNAVTGKSERISDMAKHLAKSMGGNVNFKSFQFINEVIPAKDLIFDNTQIQNNFPMIKIKNLQYWIDVRVAK